MRLSVMVLAFVCLCGVAIGIAATAQDDDVRGAFLTSRPKVKPASTGTAAKPSRRRTKTTAGPNKPGNRRRRHPKSQTLQGLVQTFRTCDTC